MRSHPRTYHRLFIETLLGPEPIIQERVGKRRDRRRLRPYGRKYLKTKRINYIPISRLIIGPVREKRMPSVHYPHLKTTRNGWSVV